MARTMVSTSSHPNLILWSSVLTALQNISEWLILFGSLKMHFTQVSIVVAALIGCAIATGGGYGGNRGFGGGAGGGYGGGAGG
ncbi:unnamed protein product, partial [Larinioides sclopetarius]